MLERGGELRVQKVDNLKAKTIRETVRENVEPGSCIMSDEHPSNTGFKPDHGIHHWVSSKHVERYLAEMVWR